MGKYSYINVYELKKFAQTSLDELELNKPKSLEDSNYYFESSAYNKVNYAVNQLNEKYYEKIRNKLNNLLDASDYIIQYQSVEKEYLKLKNNNKRLNGFTEEESKTMNESQLKKMKQQLINLEYQISTTLS